MSESVIRVVHNKENPYVMLNKVALWDEELSLSAVGLWTRLLSRPNNWKINVIELTKSCGCDKSVIYRCMKELIRAGYALSYRKKKKVGNRTVFDSVNYVIFEFKADEEFKKSFLQATFPELEKPELEKPPLLINELTNPSSFQSEEQCKEGSEVASSSDSASPESEAIYSFFLESLRKRNSSFKEPNKRKWVAEIDRFLRIDKRSALKVMEVITWSETAKYHSTSCLSPDKLRKQFDEMVMKIKAEEEKEVVRTNRNYALKLKEKYPDKMNSLSFDDKYVMNRSIGKEISFNMPEERFQEALVSLFGGQYVGS